MNYILDGKTAQYLDGTGLVTDNTLEKTPNVLKAMNGEIGNEVNSQMSIMDFAYPVIANSQVKYVVYIVDDKTKLLLLLKVFSLLFYRRSRGALLSRFF